MTAARWTAGSLGCIMVAVAAVGACSDAAPRGTATTVGGSDGGGEPLAEAATSEGGGAITPRPDLCDGLVLGGNPVTETSLAGSPPPPLGGTIIPGTYDLEELDVYAAAARGSDGGDDSTPVPPPTGRVAQVTIVVTEFAVRTVEARGSSTDAGLAPATARAVLYRVDGTSLVVTAVCPTTEQPRTIPFSAVGGGLALFVDATHRELYARR